MEVTLVDKHLSNYGIKNAINGTRTCYDSFHKSDSDGTTIGDEDKKLLRNILKAGHETPFEFINLTFTVKGLTRAILQELARHRMASFSVQSTRYTLKRMKDDVLDNLDKYFYTDLPLYKEYLTMIIEFIEKNNLWELPNDKLKFYMPESLLCNLQLNMNFRSFLNFHKLRSSDKAHFLIQDLANGMYDELPQLLMELVDLYNSK